MSKEFATFCNKYGITLEHSPPYWSQANGEVERQNPPIEKSLQIAHGTGKNLSKYLLMYHSTPQSTTGKTPSELMFNHNMKNKLSVIGMETDKFEEI